MVEADGEAAAALRVGDEVALLDHAPDIIACGVVGAIRQHRDDPNRTLYYFISLRVDEAAATELALAVASASGGHAGEPSRPTTTRSSRRPQDARCLVSPEGYRYLFDGWYDGASLLLMDDAGTQGSNTAPVDAQRDDMMRRAATDVSPCEIQFLGLSLRPWFMAPFAALGYLPQPSTDKAYSVYLCHRCLAPMFDLLSLVDHLELCTMQTPPGLLIYRRAGRWVDHRGGGGRDEVRVHLIDGAKELMYCRHLAMLMRCFVESKLLKNDVDIYEFCVVTVSRSLAARWCSDTMDEAEREELMQYDTERWGGAVVVGFFCRLKQIPDHGLSCIATLPCFQRCGIGSLLVQLAYHLCSLRQRLCGCVYCGHSGCTIERPFSVAGEHLVRHVWNSVLYPFLCQDHLQKREFELDELRVLCGTETHMMLTAHDFREFLAAHHAFFYATVDRDTVGRLMFDRRVVWGSEDATGRLEPQKQLLLFSRDYLLTDWADAESQRPAVRSALSVVDHEERRSGRAVSVGTTDSVSSSNSAAYSSEAHLRKFVKVAFHY